MYTEPKPVLQVAKDRIKAGVSPTRSCREPDQVHQLGYEPELVGIPAVGLGTHSHRRKIDELDGIVWRVDVSDGWIVLPFC